MNNENITKLYSIFDKAGYELRIVGGAVRDLLLGETPKDIDFCTDALPEEMEYFANRNGLTFIPTGIDHGTVTLGVNGEMFEVTTLRVDIETDGRHAEVAFTRSFEDDAARRDLTINAMSMDQDGNIYDYFGGQEDLENLRVRFVGDPVERIREDYLRILRFFRFAARFGGIQNSKDQIAAIIEADPNGDGLRSISTERYWLEMQKLLVAPDKDRVLSAMWLCGVLQTIGLNTPFIKGTRSDAIGELSNVLRPYNVLSFLQRWKLSAAESRKLQFLLSKQANPPRTEVEIEDLLVDGIPVDYVTSALKLISSPLVEYAENWDVPVFPVQGQDLLDAGMQPGPAVGAKLREMRWRWKDSRFTLRKEQLF